VTSTKNLKPAKRIRHTSKGLLLLFLFFFSMVIRGPLAVYGPIAHILSQDLKVDYFLIGMLSGVPAICYALFMPIGSIIVGKIGLNKATFLCLGIISVGILIRSLGNFELLLGATILIGFGVAIGNVIFPILISRDFTKYYVTLIGVITIGMNIANFSAVLLTYPMTEDLGWRLSLESWLILAFICIYLAIHYAIRNKRGGSRKAIQLNLQEWIRPPELSKIEKTDEENSRPLLKIGITYLVAIVFLCQVSAWVIITAWLPDIFMNYGLDASSASFASSLFQLLGIAGAFLTPVFIDHFGYTKAFLWSSILYLVLPVGLLFYAKFWSIYVILSGIGQSAIYCVVFGSVNEFCQTKTEVRKMIVYMQTIPYLISGLMPSFAGFIYDQTLSWDLVLWLTTLILLIMLFAGIIIAKKYLKPENNSLTS